VVELLRGDKTKFFHLREGEQKNANTKVSHHRHRSANGLSRHESVMPPTGEQSKDKSIASGGGFDSSQPERLISISRIVNWTSRDDE
jgi:hypothetical protein